MGMQMRTLTEGSYWYGLPACQHAWLEIDCKDERTQSLWEWQPAWMNAIAKFVPGGSSTARYLLYTIRCEYVWLYTCVCLYISVPVCCVGVYRAHAVRLAFRPPIVHATAPGPAVQLACQPGLLPASAAVPAACCALWQLLHQLPSELPCQPVGR